MAGPAHTASSLGSEYQHFVPQFMLRNFAHKYMGPQRTKKGNKKGKNKKNETMFRGELVVNNVNLKADPLVIEETKVSRILGMYDMYQDTSHSNTAQQRQIETMFGNLENHVSTILRRIVKAFEAGDPNAWVTREERNSIRKFLFILKYRGSTFHQRFHHETSDTYDANDKEHLEKYMKENNMKRPVDVWYQGLKTIMGLKMDTEDWKQELVHSMYPSDAMWFIMHSEMMYMSICTPSEPDNEFILTGNSYNVFEGPNVFSNDPLTGKVTEAAWTSFHEFAPLSPKLMIVLRSHILPVPEEDCYPKLKAEREAWRKSVVDDHYGTAQESSLADLPITKPRNNYSRLVNGRVEYLPGEDGTQSKAHKFCFSFFPVGTKHVNQINHILFDNAYRGTNIVFGSRDVFTRTLEWYMTNDSKLGKSVMGDSQDARRKLLVGLAALMKSLGSELEPVWTEIPDDIVSEFDRMKAVHQSLRKGLADWMLEGKKELQDNPKPPHGPKYAFLCLGGTDETFLEDMEFSTRMLKRRIKVDVRSQGQPEAVRGQLREQLIEEYLTYRPTRVLFFVQKVRLMVLKHDQEYLQKPLELSNDSPENIIAQALHNKMTPENINRLMYKAAMNDIEKMQYPFEDSNFWLTPIPSPEGALHLRLVRKMVFDLPGQLKKCGIPKVAALAEAQEKRIRQQGIGKVKGIPFSFIDDDMKIELTTRAMAKTKFQETLAGDVEASLLRKLEDVIFETTYPTPPVRSPT